MNKLDAMIADSASKKDSDSLALAKYFDYIEAGIDFLESAGDIEKLLPSEGGSIPVQVTAFLQNASDSLTPYFEVIKYSSRLIWDVKRRSYASAILDVVRITDLTYNKLNDSSDDAMQKLLKYGSFMASVVQAKNSADVANAIEAAALPAGSASIKRNAWFDFSLNAYVGAYAGKIQENLPGNQKDMSGVYGVTAPIGLAISHSCSCAYSWDFWPIYTSDKWWSLLKLLDPFWYPERIWIFTSTTVFVSPIDIGAVTAYQFQNNVVSNVAQIKLENIIAPGAYVVLGIRNVPISIGGGLQIGPELKSINDSTSTVSAFSAFRWSVFAGADIPIFDFYDFPRHTNH